MFEAREGEIALDKDPAAMAPDAGVVFIGRIRSPWTTRADCPRNMAAARAAGRQATIEIAPPYRAGLGGLGGTSHVVVLSWLGRAARNLIIQKPRHAAEPKGVFALRSPARPNPVGLHVAGLVALDAAAGLLTLDAIDVLDGTPVIDLKPYFASIDSFPDAQPPRHGDAP
ncbi:tRNA (N6-threonylcarbamoyladenosine(37)-N6)-methyltransferase TrmO [Mesorhizobium sp. ZMM04-5]|uniref:tRNA (N6-threonylcarbamoyladenosine(37)-N6)-methyltransferase TrmO n=1 Tax=Mesorhizobium marinum TaxID=3228790 RepID=A0ABV3QUY9_9HYPH